LLYWTRAGIPLRRQVTWVGTRSVYIDKRGWGIPKCAGSPVPYNHGRRDYFGVEYLDNHGRVRWTSLALWRVFMRKRPRLETSEGKQIRQGWPDLGPWGVVQGISGSPQPQPVTERDPGFDPKPGDIIEVCYGQKWKRRKVTSVHLYEWKNCFGEANPAYDYMVVEYIDHSGVPSHTSLGNWRKARKRYRVVRMTGWVSYDK